MVFIDGEQRHEALVCLRQSNRHWPGVEVEDCRRVERVAVEAYDCLVVDCRWFAAMGEFPEAPIFDDVAEIEVALSTDEIVDGDGFGGK